MSFNTEWCPDLQENYPEGRSCRVFFFEGNVKKEIERDNTGNATYTAENHPRAKNREIEMVSI